MRATAELRVVSPSLETARRGRGGEKKKTTFRRKKKEHKVKIATPQIAVRERKGIAPSGEVDDR